MKQKKRNPIIFVFLAVFCAVILAAAIDLVGNRINTRYDQLNDTDKLVLSEFDAYRKANQQVPTWNEYRLDQTTILAVNGLWGNSYIINPKSEINHLLAAKIDMPENSSLSVYRISRLALQVWKIKAAPGNFPGIGETYQVFNNEVYFTKYSAKDAAEQPYSSKHYIAFLSHEAFHYYMQRDWAGGSRFSGELSQKDLDLIRAEYEVLAQIQTELANEPADGDTLASLAKEYVNVVKQRIAANPKYLAQELTMETAEGTASYVGIKAAQIVGYDLGVMYFDNQKNVPFSEVMPMLESGGIEQSFLADRMPYETGAQLCFLLDALGINDWQQRLNEQTQDAPVTLYDVLSNYASQDG